MPRGTSWWTQPTGAMQVTPCTGAITAWCCERHKIIRESSPGQLRPSFGRSSCPALCALPPPPLWDSLVPQTHWPPPNPPTAAATEAARWPISASAGKWTTTVSPSVPVSPWVCHAPADRRFVTACHDACAVPCGSLIPTRPYRYLADYRASSSGAVPLRWTAIEILTAPMAKRRLATLHAKNHTDSCRSSRLADGSLFHCWFR